MISYKSINFSRYKIRTIYTNNEITKDVFEAFEYLECSQTLPRAGEVAA